MPVFKLKPTDVSSNHWEASTYKGPAVVRAKDEESAREKATQEFCIAVRRKPGQNTCLNPWNQKQLVTCERLENSDYDEDKPAEVLSPKDQLDTY